MEPNLKREVRSLLNKLNDDNIDRTVHRIVDLGIGDPANGKVDEVAASLVQYSYGSRTYMAPWGQLISKVVKRFPNLDFASRVLKCFRWRMQEDLTAGLEEGADAQLISQLMRDQLVIGLKLVGDLFVVGACSEHDVGCFLRLIGFLDYGNLVTDLPQIDEESQKEGKLPQCFFMSGNFPATQPARGDTVQRWRERLGVEMGLPGARIGLLQHDGVRLPLHTRFHDFDGDTCFQIMIMSPALKEEHRIEAVCLLLSRVAPQLDATDDGRILKADLLQSLEQFRPVVSKRFQFIIEDTVKKCALLENADPVIA